MGNVGGGQLLNDVWWTKAADWDREASFRSKTAFGLQTPRVYSKYKVRGRSATIHALPPTHPHTLPRALPPSLPPSLPAFLPASPSGSKRILAECRPLA